MQNFKSGDASFGNGYAANFYSPNAGVSLVADGSLTLQQNGDALPFMSAVFRPAVLPGSLTAVGLTGDLTLSSTGVAVLLNPSPAGELILAAARFRVPTKCRRVPTIRDSATARSGSRTQKGRTSPASMR